MNYIRIASTSSGASVTNVSQTLMGWSLAASSDAKVYIRDGTTNTARIIATLYLNTSQSIIDQFGPVGIQFYTGIYVDVVSGTIEGTLWIE